MAEDDPSTLSDLISHAKCLAESRGLETVAYLLGLAALEISKGSEAEPVEKPKTAPHDSSRRVRRLPSER